MLAPALVGRGTGSVMNSCFMVGALISRPGDRLPPGRREVSSCPCTVVHLLLFPVASIPTSSSQMAETPRELSSWFSTPFILKIPQIKRPVVSRFQQGWQDPLHKGSCVGALSPKEESSYMGVQVHNLLVKHFHFPSVSHWIQLIHFFSKERKYS